MGRKKVEWGEKPASVNFEANWGSSLSDDNEGMNDWELGFSEGVARAEEEPYESDEDVLDS